MYQHPVMSLLQAKERFFSDTTVSPVFEVCHCMYAPSILLVVPEGRA